jgi:hypothetical protein
MPTDIDWTRTRHKAEYDDPMQTGRRSPSGKLQWKCLRCGRTTTGAERECFSLQMMTPEELLEWQAYLAELRKRA